MTTATEVEKSPAVKKESLPLISFKVLPILKERQQQHGLRHGDYQRYHGYCSRRLRRLRETLRMPQGDRKHFKKKDVSLADVDSEKGDPRFLEIPLTLSERAWAYAMELKQDANTETRKKFHLLSRLQKGTDHAEFLYNLTKESTRVDARTKLECEAYYAFINATFLFELQQWTEAVDWFKKAQAIYSQIGQALGDHPDAAIYSEKSTELLPSMRFCAYQTGAELQISDLAAEFQSAAIQAMIAQKPKMSEIFFRKHKITVPTEKLTALLVRIDDFEKSKDRKVEMYEEILVELRDGIQAVRDSVKLEQQGPKVKPSMLLSYLVYLRLRLTNSRTELMLKEKNVPKDCIRLIEMILHNYQEMLTIPGVENDDDFQNEIDHVSYIYKGVRCRYLAEIFKSNKKWREALTLYARGKEFFQKGIKGLPKDSQQKSIIKETEEYILSSEVECHAQAILLDMNDGSTLDEIKFSKPVEPLIERLNDYVLDENLYNGQPNLVKFPYEFEPVPCKPLFFDLAGNHIKIPEEELEALAGISAKKSPSKEGAGLTGFVKGLWGWGK